MAKMRSAWQRIQRSAIALSLAGALLVSACNKSSADDTGGCDTDFTCDITRVCRNSICVDPNAVPPSGSCAVPGDLCSETALCCVGATCVDYSDGNGARCGANCTSGTGCNSGCCIPIQNSTLSVCAPAEFCGAPAECGLTMSDPTCNSCLNTECLTECNSCASNQECIDALTCIQGCTDDACQQGCGEQYPTGFQLLLGLFGTAEGCLPNRCATYCQ